MRKEGKCGWVCESACPLCGRQLTTLGRGSAIVNRILDYHHWSLEPKRGICICRAGHDIIGFDTYDTKLEERAASWGFDSRHDLQIVRLALRDAAVTNRSAGPQYASELVDRYNLPQSAARIQELLRAINAEEQLRERFVDERLVDGIEN